MELLQAEDFEPHVGKVFRFEGAAHALRLDRVEVHAGESLHNVLRRPFVLIFCGVREGAALPEGSYVCEAEPGVTFDLYVSPIHTPDAGRQDYQAVFG